MYVYVCVCECNDTGNVTDGVPHSCLLLLLSDFVKKLSYIESTRKVLYF